MNKIKFFLADEAMRKDIVQAVADAMALFDIQPAAAKSAAANREELTTDQVLVYNKVIDETTITVTTEIFFRRDNGTLGCLIHRQQTAPEEASDSAVVRLVKLNILRLMSNLLSYNPSPWGILRGVRPTKIIHRLLDRGWQLPAIIERLQTVYGLDPEKAQLVTNVAARQWPFLPPAGKQSRMISVYIGIPFCPSRCVYCSFPSYPLPRDDSQLQSFLQALFRDIEATAALIRRHNLAVETIYVGGGTPTSLNAYQFSSLLSLIEKHFVGPALKEFTVEAGRPDSITVEKIRAMQRFHVTRTSVNPQTMQQKTLNLIGRQHTVQDIINIFYQIRNNANLLINMDIIVGLPGETTADVADTVEQLAALDPDNLTIHTLARKRGAGWTGSWDKYCLPEAATVAEMLAVAKARAEQMGMQPYYLYRQKHMTGNLENIGYAKPGTECLYNIQIISERQTIIGIGPAAATKAVDAATWRISSCYNAKDLNTYITDLDRYLAMRSKLIAKLYPPGEEE